MGKPCIRVNPDHHLGTEKLPWKAGKSATERRRALAAGIRERVASGTLTEHDSVVKVKRRLSAIRTLQRNTPRCHTFEEDMRWIDRAYLRGGVTNRVCKTPWPAAARARALAAG